MPTYLVTYHGNGHEPPPPPATPEAETQMMSAFMAWVGSVGNAMADPGAPLSAWKSVSSAGSNDGPASGPIGGYTLLRAADLDTAVGLVKDHPFIARGGTLQVAEAVNLGE